MTDGDVARLLRGYYTYTRELTGYKPVEVNIDLMPVAKTETSLHSAQQRRSARGRPVYAGVMHTSFSTILGRQ